ncbi:VCBS domain-containing protein [Fluviibacterium sp. DFM31]|uniref:VCBS domain-containing protein n=1 Tax=Meridianimarinicoccus marinus TaxID=3231483 RepID=A0ABV3L6N9_9RHOB
MSTTTGLTIAGTPANEDIHGTRSDDILSGGPGSDTVRGRRGDDLLIYHVEANAGAGDTYDGGIGFDTIRLMMTSDTWADPQVQLQVAAYLAFLSAVTDGHTQDAEKEFFTFTCFEGQSLRVNRVEKLELFVDGVEISPEDDPVEANDDIAVVTEDGPVLTGNVLTNDSVPDLVGGVVLVQGPALGSLVLNDDGSYSYALDNSNPAIQALNDGDTLTDSFTYLVSDLDGDSDFATVNITINGADDGVSGVMDVQGGFQIFSNANSTDYRWVTVDGGLQASGLEDNDLASGVVSELSGLDGNLVSYDYDNNPDLTGRGRIEGEGGTGTFSLKSLDLRQVFDLDGDGWSVLFTGSNGATHSVSVPGGSLTGDYGTVDFGTMFTDVAWVDWDFDGNFDGDTTLGDDADWIRIDNIVFENLQGTTPYVQGGDPNLIEFETGFRVVGGQHEEDGFIFASLGTSRHQITNYNPDPDFEFYSNANSSTYVLSRADGASFDLNGFQLIQNNGGLLLTASNGAVLNLTATTVGDIVLDDSFHDVDAVTFEAANATFLLDDIAIA